MQYPVFQKRAPLAASDLNSLVDALKRARVLPGVGIKLTETLNGTVVSLKPQRSAGGGGSQPPSPWDIDLTPQAGATGDKPPLDATVVPGTLTGFLPTNWNEKFTVQSQGTYYAKAKIATDGEAITGVTIAIDSATPKPQKPQKYAIEGEIEYLFGIISDGQAVRTIAPGHIVLKAQPWFYGQKNEAAPGESPFDIYYALA